MHPLHLTCEVVYAPLQVLAAKPLSQADIVRHTDLTNRMVFGLVQACPEAEVPPGLVANVLLSAAAVSCST